MMLSLAINESGFGRSQISIEKNNLFGHAAYDNAPNESANGYKDVACQILIVIVMRCVFIYTVFIGLVSIIINHALKRCVKIISYAAHLCEISIITQYLSRRCI